jgi:hypothetical protein
VAQIQLYRSEGYYYSYQRFFPIRKISFDTPKTASKTFISQPIIAQQISNQNSLNSTTTNSSDLSLDSLETTTIESVQSNNSSLIETSETEESNNQNSTTTNSPSPISNNIADETLERISLILTTIRDSIRTTLNNPDPNEPWINNYLNLVNLLVNRLRFIINPRPLF